MTFSYLEKYWISNMSEVNMTNRETEKRHLATVKKDLLVLIYHYLLEEGLSETAECLTDELTWNVDQYQACDNVDLTLVLMEYIAYYQVCLYIGIDKL